jgi:hypothetical protein
VLIESIVNVRRELKFFEGVGGQFGLLVGVEEGSESDGVRGYRELFEDVAGAVEHGDGHVLEGLVVLWGTEKVRFLINSVMFFIKIPFVLRHCYPLLFFQPWGVTWEERPNSIPFIPLRSNTPLHSLRNVS